MVPLLSLLTFPPSFFLSTSVNVLIFVNHVLRCTVALDRKLNTRIITMEHTFVRDRTKRFCSLCLDAWPSSEVVTKFHSCTTCGITAHTGCLLLAKTCPYRTIQRDMSTGGAMDIHRLNRLQGSVFIQIVQAEDLITTTAGTSLVRAFFCFSS